jgi:hypothetical protein
MREMGRPYCEVCDEQLVKSIYGLLRPIEYYSPSVSSISLEDTQTVALSVVPMDPTWHDLNIQWSVDGAQVSGATSSLFVASANDLGAGQHTVTATVWDATQFVRNDPGGNLHASSSWSINVTTGSVASGDLQVTVHNVAGWGSIGTDGEVKLYNSADQLVGT